MEGAETKKRAREASKPSASAAEEDDLLGDDKVSVGFRQNHFSLRSPTFFCVFVDARFVI